MEQALSLSALLVALLGPACAVVTGRRTRIVLAAALVPVALVVVATLISAATGWGPAKADDDFENTGVLIFLVFFTAVAAVAGLVLAALGAGVSRIVHSKG